MSYEERKKVFEQMKMLVKPEQEEIFRILRRGKEHYTENSNGVFFDLTLLSDHTFEDMKDYLRFCMKTRQDDESLVLGQEVEEEDDALDDVLFKENKEQISKEHKFVPLPDILVPKSLQNSNTEIKKDTVQVLKSSAEKEEAWIKSIEKFSFKDSPIKTWLQYGLIFCFLIVLIFNFYPSSKKVEVNDYLHGKITLNGEQLKNLTIGLKGSGGEVYGFVASNGMYRVDNPPKGIIKIKLGALIPTQQNQTSGSFKKNEAKEKKKKSEVIYSKYETFENNFELEYPGGVKQFDIELKSD